ncbi:hypothetical protein FRC00_007290, partial [Tulasnella sp. 408]
MSAFTDSQTPSNHNSLRATTVSVKDTIQPENNETCAAPIHVLPNEVLTAILCMTFDAWDWRPEHSITLTRVCKRWYLLVMATSAFWSHISSERNPRIAQGTLERNRGGPLIFNLSFDESYYAHPRPTERAEVLKIALAQVHRWKTFFFLGGYRGSLFADIRRGASALEELFVELTEPADFGQVVRLSDGQSLRYLSLSGIGFDWSSRRLSGLWSLTLDAIELGPSLAQFHSILSSSPLLRVLHLKNVKLDDSLPLSMSSIPVPFLTDIYLRFVSDSLLSFLISHIERSACTSIVTDEISFLLYSRAFTLASNAIRSASYVEVRYNFGRLETTRIETRPGPMVRRFSGGTGYPGASMPVNGARLDEILLNIVDAFTSGKVDPTLLVHVSPSVEHEDPTFLGAQVVLKPFRELCVLLRAFLWGTLSREWRGEKAFIYEL